MRKDGDFEGRRIKNYVWVKDRSGKEFACPWDELRDDRGGAEELL